MGEAVLLAEDGPVAALGVELGVSAQEARDRIDQLKRQVPGLNDELAIGVLKTQLATSGGAGTGAGAGPPRPETLAYITELMDAQFKCPITLAVMVDPVIAWDGHTYERDPIARWLQRHSTSPMTGENLPDFTLRPNHSMRSQIINYGEKLAREAGH